MGESRVGLLASIRLPVADGARLRINGGWEIWTRAPLPRFATHYRNHYERRVSGQSRAYRAHWRNAQRRRKGESR